MQIYDRIVSTSSSSSVSNSSHSKSYYEHLLKTATNYDAWCEAATKLDEIDGLDHWKREVASPDYDHELIKTRLDQLRQIRKANKGQSAMIFALRTSLARNLGDMGNPKVRTQPNVCLCMMERDFLIIILFGEHRIQLYSYSRVGTKDLTCEYIDEVVKQLNWICDEPADPDDDPHLDLKAKHDFFMNIRQSFGRTALLLSGGGTLGMSFVVFHVQMSWHNNHMNLCVCVDYIGLNHIGVIKCLHEAQLLPRIISGASSGSIMASLVCTKTSDELPSMFDPSLVRLVSLLWLLSRPLYRCQHVYIIRMCLPETVCPTPRTPVSIVWWYKTSCLTSRSSKKPCEPTWVTWHFRRHSTELASFWTLLSAHPPCMTCLDFWTTLRHPMWYVISVLWRVYLLIFPLFIAYLVCSVSLNRNIFSSLVLTLNTVLLRALCLYSMDPRLCLPKIRTETLCHGTQMVSVYI